ncbi:hypothetical protein [Streptomyces kaempferi]|uniref:Uncharacterized protein n=1 Tax=Streptomyces kaempferi TaxID=333725 RepID=A0ABW3XMV0_9ACTN
MSPFGSDIGKPCLACGHPITREDPAAYLKDGNVRIHKRHTTDQKSGFYGAPVKRFR